MRKKSGKKIKIGSRVMEGFKVRASLGASGAERFEGGRRWTQRRCERPSWRDFQQKREDDLFSV